MGTQELIEELRKGTAGLTLFEIEALWGEAATALSAVVERRKTTGDRFFIDHGQIHDRATGKHVTTDEDSVFCDGINSALELLNTLNTAATEAADAITTLRAELAQADALRKLIHTNLGEYIEAKGGTVDVTIALAFEATRELKDRVKP